MKRILAILLCIMLITLSLSACGDSSTNGGNSSTADNAGSADNGSNGGSDAAADGQNDAAAKIIAERKESGVYPTVVMAYMNWSGSPAGLTRIQEAISEYTIEKYGIQVELEIMDVASYSQEMTLMLSSGEQVDLFNAITIGYTSSVNKGYCLDLEEEDLIRTYGSGILDTLNADFVDACRISGVLYGLPQQRDMAIGMFGVAIGAEYLDAIGFDYNSMYEEGEEVIYSDFAAIDSIFAQLHEAFPEKYVFTPQEATLSQGPEVDAIGGDTYGVLLDPINSLEVSNLYSSDIFKEFCTMFYNWNRAGYISADALTDDTSATSHAKAGNAMAYFTATKPGIKQQESNLCGREMIVFQMGNDFMKSSAVAAMPWCINSGTEDPAAAMQILEGFYTDPYMSNLLCWGEEGVEYQKMDDGHITFADGVSAENSEYYNNVNWELPNQFIAEIWEGDELDVWERMDDFNNKSTKSKALGFAFDNSAVASEYTALYNVYQEYVFQLMYGYVDPEVGIPEMVSKLEAAGLQKYMDAKEAALREWAEANGVN